MESEKHQVIGNKRLDTLRFVSRLLGTVIAAPFFVWFFLGFVPSVPSIIDVFGMQNLRIPAGVTIAGLVLAAFGFED